MKLSSISDAIYGWDCFSNSHSVHFHSVIISLCSSFHTYFGMRDPNKAKHVYNSSTTVLRAYKSCHFMLKMLKPLQHRVAFIVK